MAVGDGNEFVECGDESDGWAGVAMGWEGAGSDVRSLVEVRWRRRAEAIARKSPWIGQESCAYGFL